MVFLSHCLLNHNVRYLGGAERAAGARDVLDGYLAAGVGICQMPCPEQRAWGGVLKRRMLTAYGAGGTWRSPMVRALLGVFMTHTRVVYDRLAGDVADQIADYQDSGLAVVGVVGISGSPSCGVQTTLDLPAAVDVLRRCPLAQLDRRTVEERAVGAHTRPGPGLFVTSLRRQLAERGVEVQFHEHAFTTKPEERGPATTPSLLPAGVRVEKRTFESDGTRCAATLYLPDSPGPPPPCLVMGHGFTGTQDQLEPYALRFAAAGMAVLTFDYRHFGRSEGQPRQLVDCDSQLADWRAAVGLARSLDVVDPQRIALWGTSLSGSHVVRLAADDPSIAALVVQVPVFDKSARGMGREARAKMDREGISLGTLLWVSARTVAVGVYDAVRGLAGWSPHYIPVFAQPGHVAAFTDPESSRHRALFEEAGVTWRNEFTPRFVFGTPKYVEGTAERLSMPLLVCVAQHDTDADPERAIEIARRAPRGELVTYPVRHFDVYTGETREQLLHEQVAFLRRVLRLQAVPAD